MRLTWLIVSGCVVLAACSRASRDTEDGFGDAGRDAEAVFDGPADTVPDGAAEPAPDAGPLMGRHSYVVESTVTAAMPGARAPDHTFTIVLDADGQTAIVGATGGGTLVTAQQIAPGRFRLRPFGIRTASCFPDGVTYDDLTITIGANGKLTGNAAGEVSWSTSLDTSSSSRATMSLTGVPDTQPPTLTVSFDGAPTDPFSILSVSSSEPLPPGAQAMLVSGSGDQFPLLPTSGSAVVPTFSGPGTMLRPGEAYHVIVDGIADYAGNAALVSNPSFTIGAAPVLIGEEGFESATGTMLGGAQILSGTDAPVLAGAQSLYIPPTNGPFGPRWRVTQFAVRLTVAAGDTVVRFSYRHVNPYGGSDGTMFAVASIGGRFAWKSLSASTTTLTPASIPGQGTVMLGPLVTAEIPLPSDAAGEVVFGRVVQSSLCGLPPPPAAGIVIDDLRVE